MKTIKFIALVTILVSLISCGDKNALVFNDKLVSIQKEVFKKIDVVENDTIQTDITKQYQELQKFVKGKIQELKVIDGPADGERFKQSMIDYMDGINAVYDASINMLKEVGNAEKLGMYKDEFTQMQTNAEKLEEKVIKEQKIFAGKHNIRLDKDL